MYFAQLCEDGECIPCYVAEEIIIDDDIMYYSDFEEEVNKFCEKWNREEKIMRDKNSIINDIIGMNVRDEWREKINTLFEELLKEKDILTQEKIALHETQEFFNNFIDD